MGSENYYGAYCEAILKAKELAAVNVTKVNKEGVPVQNRNVDAFEFKGVKYSWIDIQTLAYVLDGSEMIDQAKDLGVSIAAVRARKAKLADKMGFNLKWEQNKFYKECLRFLFDIYPLIVKS